MGPYPRSHMVRVSNPRGRKVGGRCRSAVLNVRTGPRRFFADAAELADRAAKRSSPKQQLMTVRPKPVVQITYRNGHKVINLIRLPEVVQVLKGRH